MIKLCQLLIAAAALLKDLLLADEPTGNLDRESTSMVMELLTRIHRKNGMTLILVTHDPSAAAYAHRQVRMSDGLIDPNAPNPPAVTP